jgi:hypothetical protein
LRRGGKQSSETFYDEHLANDFCRLLTVLSPEEALAQFSQVQPPKPDCPTLDEWSVQYIEHLTGITPGTRLTTPGCMAGPWQPLIGHLHLHLLSRDDVARSVNALSARYCDKSVANAHGLLAAMMAEAVDAGETSRAFSPAWAR